MNKKQYYGFAVVFLFAAILFFTQAQLTSWLLGTTNYSEVSMLYLTNFYKTLTVIFFLLAIGLFYAGKSENESKCRK